MRCSVEHLGGHATDQLHPAILDEVEDVCAVVVVGEDGEVAIRVAGDGVVNGAVEAVACRALLLFFVVRMLTLRYNWQTRPLLRDR